MKKAVLFFEDSFERIDNKPIFFVLLEHMHQFLKDSFGQFLIQINFILHKVLISQFVHHILKIFVNKDFYFFIVEHIRVDDFYQSDQLVGIFRQVRRQVLVGVGPYLLLKLGDLDGYRHILNGSLGILHF